MTDIDTCEAAYLSRKYYIQRFYEGIWLFLDDPLKIAFQWFNDGIVAELKAEKLLYDMFKEDRFHVYWDDPRIARADLPKKTS